MESTFIMVKPDGVKRRLVGEVISRFERCGYNLLRMRVLVPTEELLKKHYAEHVGKPFFKDLVGHILSGRVVAMVWSGKGAVKGCRKIIGETDPGKSSPGTIRGDFCIEIGRNIVHGSDSPEVAKQEIKIWFGEEPDPVPAYDHDLLYE